MGSTDQAGGDGVVGQSQQCWMETRYIQVSESHRRVSGSQVSGSPGGSSQWITRGVKSSESVGHLGVKGQVSGSPEGSSQWITWGVKSVCHLGGSSESVGHLGVKGQVSGSPGGSSQWVTWRREVTLWVLCGVNWSSWGALPSYMQSIIQ